MSRAEETVSALSAAAKGSVALREALKKECERRGWKGLVRVNKAGCLDQCHLGPTVVVYPEQVWYGGVKIEDVPKICDAHEKGEPCRPLLIPDEHLTGKGSGPFHAGNVGGGF